jgi:hypothetical protein
MASCTATCSLCYRTPISQRYGLRSIPSHMTFTNPPSQHVAQPLRHLPEALPRPLHPVRSAHRRRRPRLHSRPRRPSKPSIPPYPPHLTFLSQPPNHPYVPYLTPTPGSIPRPTQRPHNHRPSPQSHLPTPPHPRVPVLHLRHRKVRETRDLHLTWHQLW